MICESITGSATFGRVQSIEVRNMSLSGTLPSSIGNFGNMTRISLYGNRIYGTLPSTISRLASLQYLDLHSNLLSGTIPSTISALMSLRYLDLSTNYLTMGTATSVPTSTFSPATLSGFITLAENCLVFDTTSPYPYRHVTATHCRSTGKYEVCCSNIRLFDIILSFVSYFLFSPLHITVITLDSLP